MRKLLLNFVSEWDPPSLYLYMSYMGSRKLKSPYLNLS